MSESSPNTEHRGMIAWFLNNHVAANILMMLFLVGGFITAASLRTETFPAIDPKLITVTVVYPGATPSEVENAITSRVEDALTGIEGVKRITATSAEGSGTVSIEMNDFADGDTVYDDVDTAVNGLSDFPPEDAERPIVRKVKVTPPVMTLALHGDVGEAALKYWAEEIEDDLRVINGVANTALSGIREYEISIEISENTLREYGLTLRDISAAVQNFSTDIPAGTIESRSGDILLRVQERRYVQEEFEAIPIRRLESGSVLTLGDIATVKDGFEDSNVISRFNGETAAMITISRSETVDTLGIVRDIKAYLDTLTLPQGLTLTLQNDDTVALRDRISLMVRNGVIGFMLVFVILLLFLDLKLAFWTSIAVPVSFLGGLMIMGALGYSMNMVSAFALIIVLGVVVDDAIIVGEAIFEEQKAHPDDPNATLRAVYSVLGPVTVGVLTTVAAFAPLLLSTGTLGQIIGVIPAVVIPILLVSLFEAYFILPSHLSNSRRWSMGVIAIIRNGFAHGLRVFTTRIVAPFCGLAIRMRYAALALFIAVAIVTFSLVTSGVIRFVFLPNIESDKVDITVEMPVGTPFALTRDTMTIIEDIVLEIEKKLESDSDGDSAQVIRSVTTTIGQRSNNQGGPGALGGASFANNIGQIQIQLVPSDFRDISSRAIEGLIRPKIETLPNIETLNFQSSLIQDDPDIELYLTHPEEAVLNKASEELKDLIAAIPGTKEVTDSFEEGKTEYIFELTDEGRTVGLTPARLGQQLRGAFFGLEAQRIQRGKSEVIVYVRYPKAERESLDMLQAMRVRLDDGREVPLSTVATIRERTGYSVIETYNGKRFVDVTLKADTDVTTPNEILTILTGETLPALVAKYQGLDYSLEGESREQQEDLASLGRNMLIAVMVIYVLLGAQLRSYIQPLVIMSAIPFGIVGALLGHYFLGHDLTFISLFGMVALSGVVVNDSVVLIDYMNHDIARGKAPFHAAMNAVRRRFRPILLTTMTTSIGLLPIMLEPSIQAQFLVPMVVSLATGIIFATVIIMILVPALVLIIDDIKRAMQRIMP